MQKATLTCHVLKVMERLIMGSRRWIAAKGDHWFSISFLICAINQQGTIFSCQSQTR